MKKLIFLVILITACQYSPYKSRSNYTPITSNDSNFDKALSLETHPWEIWDLGFNLKGRSLIEPSLLEAEEFYRVGNYANALDLYKNSITLGITSQDKETAVSRIASIYLINEQAFEALNSLSSYYSKLGKSVNEVDPQIALIYAYANGANNNPSQAFAWFERSLRFSKLLNTGKNDQYISAVENGLKLYSRSLATNELNNQLSNWSSVPYLNSVIKTELNYRKETGFVPDMSTSFFWKLKDYQDPGTFIKEAPSSLSNLGVMLPLTGKYKVLGVRVKEGIELAIQTHGFDEFVNVIYKDTAGSADQAVTVYEELVDQDQVDFVLGPLLSDPSYEVSKIALKKNVPMLSFSKNRKFKTNENIFRLGVTIESQIDSLFEDIKQKTNINNIAIIYPDSKEYKKVSNNFVFKLRELGLNPSFEKAYSDLNVHNLDEINSKLNSHQTEAIFMPGSLEDLIKLKQVLYETNPDLKYLGLSRWNNLESLMQSKNILNGIIFPNPYFNNLDELNSSFTSSYTSLFKYEPDFLAAQAFDATTLLIAAVKRDSQEGTNNFMQSFRNIEYYQGLTGFLTVDYSGEVKRKLKVVEFINNNLVELTKIGEAEIRYENTNTEGDYY